MRLRRGIIVAIGVALLVSSGTTAAVAGEYEDVEISGHAPGSDSPDSPGGGAVECPKDSATGVETCSYGAAKWNGRCYVRAMNPQPDSASPRWDGHRDAAGNLDGVFLVCLTQKCAQTDKGGPDGELGNGMLSEDAACTSDRFWAAGVPGVVSPRVLAQRAVASMRLRAPQIGMTGGDPPDGMQIIGVPAWLWAADPGESTTGPITRTATEGAASVTATAVLDKTVWSMGDGVKVTCSGKKAAGTPWERRYGGDPSPTCGYTYQRTSAGQPDEAYTVTVRAYWTVTWSGGGQSGTIPVEVYRSIPKRVGEVQSILVPNPEPR